MRELPPEPADVARISDVIERLRELQAQAGNLPVVSVDYHSDYSDDWLTVSSLSNQILMDNGHCLIKG